MSLKIENNKSYLTLLTEDFFKLYDSEYYEDYLISYDIIRKISKDLAIPYDLYRTLYLISKESASILVRKMINESGYENIHLLVDVNEKSVVGYSLDSRTPILNDEFIKRVSSLVGTSSEVELDEIYYLPEEKISSVIIKKKTPIQVEMKREGYDSNYANYDIGILLVNEEDVSSYSRLVVYIDGQPLYLPASYYNSTTSRYKRATSSSVEALEVLVLKIIDDLRNDLLLNKIIDFHYRYRANRPIPISYEEYNTLLSAMRKIPSIIEENSYLDSLLSYYEEFEKRYAHLDDQKSSYIWRCTALSNLTISSIVSMTSKILKDIDAPKMEYFRVRELLGSYISTNRIAEEIAKEDIQ